MTKHLTVECVWCRETGEIHVDRRGFPVDENGEYHDDWSAEWEYPQNKVELGFVRYIHDKCLHERSDYWAGGRGI